MTDYKITDLTSGVPAAADLFPFVKVGDHSTPPAGTGGSDQKVTAADAGLPFGPSGDITGAKDTAAINAVSQAGQIANLLPGTYYFTNLLPDSFGGIDGSGPGTILQAVSGTTGDAIALLDPTTTQQVTLRNFTLIPNTGTLNGINLDNTGFTPAIFDPRHLVENVYVFQAGGDGIILGANVRGTRVTGCQLYWGSGKGINISAAATDCDITSNVIGQSQDHCIYVAGGNHRIIGNKGFFGGLNQSTSVFDATKSGLYMDGCTYNIVVGNSFQQNGQHGIECIGASNCTITGNELDSNGASLASDCAGIDIWASTGCVVAGNSGDNNGFLSPAAQQWGIRIGSTCTDTEIGLNTVSGTSGPFTVNGSATGYSGGTFYAPVTMVAPSGNGLVVSTDGTTTSGGALRIDPFTDGGGIWMHNGFDSSDYQLAASIANTSGEGRAAFGGISGGWAFFGATTSSGNPVMFCGNQTISGPGPGNNSALTVWDDNSVQTINNTLDDGSGNAAFAGGLSTAVRTITSSGAVSATDSLVLLNAATLTATLPTAVGITGRQYTVKLITASTGTVATTSAQTIDGSTTYTLSAAHKYVTVVSDGANWQIVASN